MVDGENNSAFGAARYGDSAYGGDAPDTDVERVVRPEPADPVEHPTDADAFGSGRRLAGADAEYPWDLVINDAGSFATVSGMDMLFQDLAFGLDATIQSQLNGPTYDEALADLERDIEDALAQDQRIDSVREASVTQEGVDTYRVETGVVAEDGQYHEDVRPIGGR